MIDYWVDEHKFRDYGVTVGSSKGLLAGLTPKERTKHDWKDRHGEEVMLSAVYYEARDISLECTLVAPTMELFLERVANFTKLFSTPLKKRLKVGVTDDALVYDVYLADKIDIDKKWRAGQCYGKFTLSLREPEPIKQVYKFTQEESSMVVFQINTNVKLNVSFGEGSNRNNILGLLSFGHTYTTPGTKYIIVSGSTENKVTTTNATLIWSNLM